MKEYKGCKSASEEKYIELLLTSHVADDEWHFDKLGSLHSEVQMSTSPQATLDIKIQQ